MCFSFGDRVNWKPSSVTISWYKEFFWNDKVLFASGNLRPHSQSLAGAGGQSARGCHAPRALEAPVTRREGFERWKRVESVVFFERFSIPDTKSLTKRPDETNWNLVTRRRIQHRCLELIWRMGIGSRRRSTNPSKESVDKWKASRELNWIDKKLGTMRWDCEKTEHNCSLALQDSAHSAFELDEASTSLQPV